MAWDTKPSNVWVIHLYTANTVENLDTMSTYVEWPIQVWGHPGEEEEEKEEKEGEEEKEEGEEGAHTKEEQPQPQCIIIPQYHKEAWPERAGIEM